MTLGGNIMTAAGTGFGAVEFLGAGAGSFLVTPGVGLGGSGRLSSPELQLDPPKAAIIDNTNTVKASRDGVHKPCPLFVFLFSCI
jgi:hypothetical protein